MATRGFSLLAWPVRFSDNGWFSLAQLSRMLAILCIAEK